MFRKICYTPEEYNMRIIDSDISRFVDNEWLQHVIVIDKALQVKPDK